MFIQAPLRVPHCCRVSKPLNPPRYQLRSRRYISRMSGSPHQMWDPSRGIRFAQKRSESRVVQFGFVEAVHSSATTVRMAGNAGPKEEGQDEEQNQRRRSWFSLASKEEVRETGNSKTTTTRVTANTGSEEVGLRKEQRLPRNPQVPSKGAPGLYPRLETFQAPDSSLGMRSASHAVQNKAGDSDLSGDEQWVDAVEAFEREAWQTELKPRRTELSRTAKAPTPAPAKVLADPPVTDLEFNICAKSFGDAQKSAPGSPESFWSYALYRGPVENGVENRVKVHYCKSKHTVERVCQYFADEKVLGFDLEWLPNATRFQGPRQNVSLIQLASPSRIALFHTAIFPSKDDDLVAPSLRKIMEDPEITKVGVAIKGDCTRMRKFLGIDSKGLFELSHLYKLVKFSKSGQGELVNKYMVSLATQVQEHLGLPLFKGIDVRSSDWTKPLSMDQIIYSASDAYAGVHLYHVMEKERESLDPCPPRPYHAELGLPIRLAEGVSIATDDENTDAAETKGDTTSTGQFSTTLIDAAKQSLQVEEEANSDGCTTTTKDATVANNATPKTRKTPRTPKSAPKDPRVVAAESWLLNYRSTEKALRAAPSALRAYCLWHADKALNPQELAKLLRDPPLQLNTVVGYILEAIRLEKLPYEKKRLKNEVLAHLPKEVLEGRYKAFVLAVQD